ncbi:MAG TPA: 4-alpha-glucanotransferase, partial [Tepidisphaeraceae bacterium]|nr:4-alpha-glucanotransferase [Tepidisphaeraceae bacterium]
MRTAGILLHITSLPGRFGIGDLGPQAYAFVNQLAQARQTWWQILPLGPPGAGDCPYQCYSAFAGNPLLISPELLAKEGLLTRADLSAAKAGHFPADQVDYARVNPFKARLLERAWEQFDRNGSAVLHDEFATFCDAESGWLDDFALFMA